MIFDPSDEQKMRSPSLAEIAEMPKAKGSCGCSYVQIVSPDSSQGDSGLRLGGGTAEVINVFNPSFQLF
ncbi:hypothetical protein BGE01nite_37550 [Brevifollis gellanilyticus]|uniref:Uncharacterized protein n=1 Tax=Brevifollis gellanilyticus TaxID=748831 RepID=A0A512MCJ3_9BACT|nr:hypothetical protein BGE01nite_37550 [Brevifollis gellanilyticus]